MTATLESPVAPATATTTTGANKMKGLEHDLIQSLMAGSRSKNVYGPKLLEFMQSDEAGINPQEIWPVEFGGKTCSTMYQGFIKAAKDAKLNGVKDQPDQVRILQRDDAVFILNLEKVKAALDPNASDDDTDDE